MERRISLRILAVSSLRYGGNDESFVRAFRRAGHSVLVVSPENYLPTWRARSLKIVKRIFQGQVIRDFNQALIEAIGNFSPDLFFVFKGENVSPEVLQTCSDAGVVTINFYPDTGFADFGSTLLQTIPMFDWFFTTKPGHLTYLESKFAYRNVTFLPHAFDPEIHGPLALSERDWLRYVSDVSFIGNFSLKKQSLIEHICRVLPKVDLRVWGARYWDQASSEVRDVYQGTEVWGAEYAKAISASKISLGLLYEGTPKGPGPDVLTARTFEIPGVGGFMLHERTAEVMHYFEDGKECVFFSDKDDLIAKIEYYLRNDHERVVIAAAGRARSLKSGYSYDARVSTIVQKYQEICTDRCSDSASSHT